MAGHNAGFELFDALLANPGRDPGNAGTITADRTPFVLGLVSTGSETRTLARPTRAGQEVFLYMKTDGGDIVVTVTGGINEDGETTFTFSDPDQFLKLQAVYNGTTYVWRKVSDYTIGNLSQAGSVVLDGLAGLTASASDLNTLDVQVLGTSAGTGFTSGTGTIYKQSVHTSGTIIKTTILIDLTGLSASATDVDIIGTGVGPAHLGQITTAVNGTIFAGTMSCLEVPAGAADDVDLYAATEATGAFDTIITDLAETALVTAGAAWTADAATTGHKVFEADVAANKYLYVTCGEGSANGTYTAGKFLITLYGYA